ncbi:hypothetical protein DICPUDRAFT_151284 [Dictyostelium purpureum]|uniref:Copper transport protein n=1 Tax=Dictyostelium purpureum TaxID=5786 RepID=F0ZIG5_DICPU|nr:uncharacterized protein DICPUDRAFT_151284 [Dictyostelium purpureum]EGC36256.1 hypothetical protein DICPUDRAFT_151284 [Dictyostelium purpureum]|eukprot:XP_003287202.1 hypothetical protein DICPUDRAFT_151284 [Dictyostelium purpureum]
MSHNHGGGTMTNGTMDSTGTSIGLLKFTTKVSDLLFSSWSTESFWSYTLAIVIVFLASCILEFLNFLKQKVYQTYSNNINDPHLRLSKWKNIWKYKIYLMLLHMITLAFHYILMLIIMSFNLGLIFSILIGAGVGYIAFLENPLGSNNSQYISMKETKTTQPSSHCSTSPSTIIINSFDEGDDEL